MSVLILFLLEALCVLTLVCCIPEACVCSHRGLLCCVSCMSARSFGFGAVGFQVLQVTASFHTALLNDALHSWTSYASLTSSSTCQTQTKTFHSKTDSDYISLDALLTRQILEPLEAFGFKVNP